MDTATEKPTPRFALEADVVKHVFRGGSPPHSRMARFTWGDQRDERPK